MLPPQDNVNYINNHLKFKMKYHKERVEANKWLFTVTKTVLSFIV